jgi:hypothetical protein
MFRTNQITNNLVHLQFLMKFQIVLNKLPCTILKHVSGSFIGGYINKATHE